MLFREYGITFCSDGSEPVWGLFQFSVAPELLYYSYIPVLIGALIIFAYIYPKRKESVRSSPLLLMLAFFALWVLNILLQWVAARHDVIMFGWQLTAMFEAGLFLSAAYFAYVFVSRKDMPHSGKLLLLGLWTLVCALVPTQLNIAAYDVQNCEGVTGPLWHYLYDAEALSIVAIFIGGMVRALKEKERAYRDQAAIFTLSITFCLTVFFLSNFIGELTGEYEFNLWGTIGMAAFFTVLGYLIVKFHTFHTKAIATEALVWGLVILVGSQFFYVTSPMTLAIDMVTFVAAAIIGWLQIKMVKTEIAQKQELSTLLQQRESLQHLVTHKVKGAFTRTKFIFAEFMEGTFGPTNEKMRDMARQGLEFSDDGISSVDQVLNAANLKKGKVTYEKKPVDFKGVVLTAIAQKKGPAERKGLALVSEIEDAAFQVTGDVFWLKEVAYNYVDNAVKYTSSGTITVGLQKKGTKLLYWVKDTGGGITDEDKKVLFTEGGRGKNSTKINADSTGYGLFTIKLVIEGHKGRAWAESQVGKGTTFFAELPLSKEK